ncbi:MAG: ABC transporter permease [Pseudonocardiaceae bacterium]
MNTRPASARVVWLITRREFLNRVRTRSFLVSTLVLLLVLGGYLAYITFVSAQDDQASVGLAPSESALSAPLLASATALGQQLEILEVDGASGERMVRDGTLDAVLLGGPGSYRLVGMQTVDDTLRGIVQGALTQQVIADALRQAGVDPAEVAVRAQVNVETLETRSEDFGARLAIGLISAGLLYLALLIYGSTVAQGVLEEKTSRVVELLLSTVKPWQLMIGKVAGVGAAGLLQFAVIAAVGLFSARITGAIELPSATPVAVLAGLVSFLLGFFVYAILFAAAGSLVSRTEELQAVTTPITLLVVVPFIAAFQVADNPTGPLVTGMSVVPFFAPILIPILISLGVAAGWQIALAAGLTVGTIAVLALVGGRIYRNSVLRTGGRVRLREALRTPSRPAARSPA